MIAGLLAALLVSPASASIVKAQWSSSSNAPADDAGSYEAARLGDGKLSTAWFEGVDGAGLNEWIEADLGGAHTVTSLAIFGGWGYSKSYWGHYNRPKQIKLTFSDGSEEEHTLDDTFPGQVLTLSKPRQTSSVRVQIKSNYSSDAYNDTAISEIQIFDTTRDGVAAPRSATASSTFPADADGTYDARNTVDSIVDTMWCEGNKSGDGTGEWVELSFPGPQSMSRLALRNGNGSSFGLYMKGNRATELTLSFSDGSRATLAVKDLISEQTLDFGSRTADKVRISVTGVKKGSEFNDLCLSELTFLP